MILPNKYIPLGETYLGLGTVVLSLLRSPLSVSGLWQKMKELPQVATYERFVLTLDFLYSLRAIELDGGVVKRRGA